MRTTVYIDRRLAKNDQITPLEYEESYIKLTFRDHIHDKVSKAYAMLGIIKRNFK